jgi:Tol biopolymer transport system component/DNA-binding winged helix-turn-helix (wHTH) protein
MKALGTKCYEFGSFKLNASERCLWQDENLIPLTPKAIETLIALVERRGKVVEKDTLLNEVWQDTFVEEATLAQNIFTLRKILGRDEKGNQFIETVPRRGYRFAADVRENSAAEDDDQYFLIGKQTTRRIIAEQEEIETSVEPDSPETEIKKVSALNRKPFLSQHIRTLILTAIILLISAAVFYFVFNNYFSKNSQNFAAKRFEKIESRLLTNAGNVRRIALSPDGKYLAYTADTKGKRGLFLRNLESPNALELVPPIETVFRGITFSPDSTQIYYVADEMTIDGLRYAALYQISTVGGVPKKLVSDVDTPVTFSPDGKKIAFIRFFPEAESHLIVANADGTNETVLAAQNKPRFFGMDGAAWSPDGERIACPIRNADAQKNSYEIAVFSARDGKETILPLQKWTWIGRISWLGDGSGLVFPAWDENSEIMSDQIWAISYPEGQARKITQNINGFSGVGLTEKADALATLRSEKISSWWLAKDNEFSAARKISNITGDMYADKLGVDFAPEGKIVFASRNGSGGSDIWTMDADGQNRRPLTNEKSEDYSPAVSPDGGSIVFVSHRDGGKNLWRMNRDGTEVKKLTGGDSDEDPNFSADGEWIVYISSSTVSPTLWKIPSKGGEPVQITKNYTKKPRISPDGKFIACLYTEPNANRASLTILNFSDGSVVKKFDAPAQQFGILFQWSNDGKNIVYVKNSGGVSNLWTQPIDGSEAKQLTDFNEDQIFRFARTRDGKQFIIERGNILNDVVLIRDRSNSE